MYKYLRYCGAGFIFFLVACGSSNTSDGTGNIVVTGGAGSVTGPNGGSGAIDNSVGGDGAGGATVGDGGASAGGVLATGGRRTILATGGTTLVGTAVCDDPTLCGQVLDANGDVFDCGFNNCPQTLCGVNSPNHCPPSVRE